MSRIQAPKPGHPKCDHADVRKQPELPVEPDDVQIPPVIPDDPGTERPTDTAAVRQQASPRRSKAPRSAPGLPLPHERDESPEPAVVAPDLVIAQAKRDVDAGMVDTDMRATPGLDAKLRVRLVPGPGNKPPSGR